jgi:hypothetical protein
MITYAILKNGNDTGQSVEADSKFEAYTPMCELLGLETLVDMLEYRLVKIEEEVPELFDGTMDALNKLRIVK